MIKAGNNVINDLMIRNENGYNDTMNKIQRIEVMIQSRKKFIGIRRNKS
jgi:hypothetical protein